MRSYNVIDLFSGCGGFSNGFEQAGFKVLLGIDIWGDALRTFKENHSEAQILEKSLTDVSGNEILDLIGKKKTDIDVIIGGPPCQGFSISGKRILDDPRNQLYKSYVRILRDIRPKIFVMENVLGLIKLFNGEAKDAIVESLENSGYVVKYQILMASDYGVPQNRKRVFFVGVRSDIFNSEFIFPETTHGENKKLPYLTCKDAISDLPLLNTSNGGELLEYTSQPNTDYQKIMRMNSPFIYNHTATIHKEKTVKTIALVPDGGNYKSLPEHLKDSRRVNIAWTRMNSNKPCFTIDTGHNHHFHYKANRVPTVRESARIQSFSDDFIFHGTKTSQLKQVGNAVPPLLSKNIATVVYKMLEGVENNDL